MQLAPDLSPEGLGLLLDNPDLFLLHYFAERIEKLEPFHLTLINVAARERLGLVLFPAGHGKTTIVSELLPIWAICRDPNIRIGLVAKNQPEAQAITRSVQAELAQNERLVRDFGPFIPEDSNKAWALNQFDVDKRTRQGKSTTWSAFGAGSRGTLGYRTDWTICDDVVTDKTSSSPTQRENLRQWFNQGPKTMADGITGRLTVVGTLFHPEDLYHDIREMVNPDTGEPIYTTARYEAILDWENHTVLWPERRPWLWLMEQKATMGTLDFNKRYQNVAVDPSRMVFRQEYIHGGYVGREKYPGCLDHTFTVGDRERFDGSRVYQGFDPAIGGTRSAKFCAQVTLAVSSCALHDRCLWVVDLKRDQLTLPQQVETILENHHRYQLDASVVEANSYQGGLLDAISAKMDDLGVQYRVLPHYTNRSNKPDPELGVQSMAPWFEAGKVHIPYGDPPSRKRMDLLIDELVQYPSGRTTDCVMAFWFAWRTCQEQAPRFQSTHYTRKFAWHRDKGDRRFVKNPYYEQRAE